MADEKKTDSISNAHTIALINAMTATIKSVTGPTLEDEVHKTKRQIEDAYQNSVLGIGNKDVVESFTNYGFSNDTLNWTLWLALYNDSWVFRRAIDKPAQDVVNHGITLICNQDTTKVQEELEKHTFDMTQLIMWGSLFGGAIAVKLFNTVRLDYMYQSIDKAFNEGLIDKNSILKLYVTDRWYGVAPSTDEIVTNMKSRHFGKPKYYEIMFADGKRYKIHHTWVIRYEHRIAPNLVKKGMLQGWGYAEGAHILNELSRDDKLKASIHSLINKSLIEVIKMAGMRGVFMGADQDNEAQLRKRLEMVNWGRNFNSLTFLDKDDEYQQNTFPGLSGLSDLLEKNMWLVAAALDMQGILFGDLKGGFSNDTEAMVRYNETIQLRKNSYYREPLTDLLETIYRIHGIKEKVRFTFNSLIVKKDEDNLRDLNLFGQFISQMIGDGVMTPQSAAKALKKYSEQSGIDLCITDEDIEKLKDTTEEEMENIDLDEGEEIEEIEEKPKKKFKLFARKPKDSFIEDMRHVGWIERKYKSKYPSLRVAWYDPNPRKQAATDITLSPSLYIFSDKHAVGRNPQAYLYSIRFSDHPTYFNCKDNVKMPKYDGTNAALYEKAADKYIATHPELMEELYGT